MQHEAVIVSSQKTNINKLNPKKFQHEKIPYTIIANKVIENCTNPSAMQIWLYLQTKIETWIPNKYEIMKRFNLSERSYDRYMSYLCKSNLIKFEQERLENGTFGTATMIVLNGTDFDESHKKNVVVDNFAKNEDDNKYFVNSTKRKVKSMTSIRTAKNGGVEKLATSPHRQKTAPRLNGGTYNNNTRIINNNNTRNKTPISPLTGGIGDVSKISLQEKNKNQTTQTKITMPTRSKKKTNGILGLKELLADNRHNIPTQLLSDWIVVRKDKKAPLTQSAWNNANTVMDRLVKNNTCPILCFGIAVENAWRGMRYDWFAKEVEAANRKHPYPAYKPYEEYQQTKNEITHREEMALRAKQEELHGVNNFKLQLSEKIKSESSENFTPKRSLSEVYSEILQKQPKFGN